MGTSPKKKRTRQPSFWRACVRLYGTADPRSLAVFRILFGTLLLWDVARRWPDLTDHYSNSGWLTNHFAIYRPMSDHLFSLYLAFGTPEEVKVFAAVHMAVSLALIVGFHTKIMQVLSAVLITSLNSRNIMLENGGFVVVHLLAVWSMFLPLGRRFSIDAWRASYRFRRETSVAELNDHDPDPLRTRPVASLAVTALILQFAIIYYFNVVHKSGPAWRDGTAVYYFFQQDRMVTGLGAWLRHVLPLGAIQGMTYGALVLETGVVICLLSPAYTAKARMVGWLLVLMLHSGIDAVVQLGPFSYAVFVVHAVFIPRQFWDYLVERRNRRFGRRRVYLDPDDPLGIYTARIVKRLALPNRVVFVGVPAGASYSGPRGNLAEPITHERLRRGLLVSDGSAKHQWSGHQALYRLSEVMALPRICFAWLAWQRPGTAVASWVDRLFARNERYSRLLGLTPATLHGQGPRRQSARTRTVERARHYFAQLGVGFVMICCTSQVLIENRAIPEQFKPKTRPDWMTAVVVYPRLFQGWSMFAPDPPHDDGKIVVEGVTQDGRHFDPLSQGEPNYELNPPEGFRMNQLWGDFHRRIWEPRFRSYWNGVRDYLVRHHELTGKPEDRLVSFEVFYLSEVVPPPGAPRPAPQKQRLFSWSEPKANQPPQRSTPRPLGPRGPRSKRAGPKGSD